MKTIHCAKNTEIVAYINECNLYKVTSSTANVEIVVRHPHKPSENPLVISLFLYFKKDIIKVPIIFAKKVPIGNFGILILNLDK